MGERAQLLGELHALRLGGAVLQRDDGIQHLVQVERVVREGHLAAVQTVHVQHVADNLYQVLARLLRPLQMDRRGRRVVEGAQSQLVRPDDGVERRADVVRHLGEKVALEAGAGAFEFRPLVLAGQVVQPEERERSQAAAMTTLNPMTLRMPAKVSWAVTDTGMAITMLRPSLSGNVCMSQVLPLKSTRTCSSVQVRSAVCSLSTWAGVHAVVGEDVQEVVALEVLVRLRFRGAQQDHAVRVDHVRGALAVEYGQDGHIGRIPGSLPPPGAPPPAPRR